MGEEEKNVIRRFFISIWRCRQKIYSFLIIFVLTCLLFVLCLYGIDRAMPYFSSLPHNRTGDAWFSVLGCLLPAVASILLALVAIEQTQKLNMLDRKMRRPALALRSAELTAWYLNQKDYKTCKIYMDMSAQQQGAVRDYLKDQQQNPNFCLLKVNLSMLLKNEINIEKIEVINFKFLISLRIIKM